MLMIAYAMRENLLPPIRSKYPDLVSDKSMISMESYFCAHSSTSFHGKTSGDIAKCLLFPQPN